MNREWKAETQGLTIALHQAAEKEKETNVIFRT